MELSDTKQPSGARPLPVVALVGRPNAGKSSLFNRLTRSRDAIVDDRPGVTRDRHYGRVIWDDVPFSIVDTGGYMDGDADFGAAVRRQIDGAVAAADAVILILDGKSGPSPFDTEMIDRLRPLEKPVFFAVNKIDGPEREDALYEFYGLGIDDLYPVSAAHGYGVTDLIDDLVETLPRVTAAEEAAAVRLAVVGRPNVGKSSLINAILGEERLVVSEAPGTTRDSVDAAVTRRERHYRLIDTAGIRRKGKVSEKLEKITVIKALGSLDRCDVALLMLDAAEGVTEQDVRIAGYAYERGCGCVFLLNKWDLVRDDSEAAPRLRADLREAARFLGFAPILTVSALTGHRLSRIFDVVNAVYAQYTTRVSTGILNRALTAATERTPPPIYKGRRIKFYYATQVATRPPTLVAFVNSPSGVHFSYHRYLINRFREELGLDRTPLRLIFRERSGRKPRRRKRR